MIPIRDNIRPNILPFFTVVLIAANIGVFLNELRWGPADFKYWVGMLGMTPLRLTTAVQESSLNPLS